MPAAGAIGAVTSLAGSMSQQDAAEEAAQTQADAANLASERELTAARESMALQREMFDRLQANQQPWLSAGTGSINRLAQLMGIDTYTGGRPAVSNTPSFADFAKSMGYGQQAASGFANQAGQNLYHNPITGETRYFKPGENTTLPNGQVLGGAGANYAAPAGSEFQMIGWQPVGDTSASAAAGANGPGTGQSLDELMDAYNKLYGAQQGTQNARDADFGALTRKFTQQDFYADPVIQLGMEYGRKQGEKQLNARAAAGGGYFAGQTLKALTQFNQDYAGTKAGESRDRFIGDQTNLYNRYAGLAGSGQNSAQNIGSAGMGMANQSGSLLMGATGNANQYNMVGANAMASGYQARGQNMVGGLGALNYFGQRYLGGNSLGGDTSTSPVVDPYSYSTGFGGVNL